MKKTRWITALLAATALIFTATGCNFSDDDDDEEETSSTSTSTAQSTSVAKGAAYSETVTLDLSSSALNSSGVSKFAVDEDVTDFFALSEVSTARAAAGSSSIADFKAVVTAVSATSITVEMTATAPTVNCKVVVAISIPADYTESGKAVVQNVAVVNVGETSATASSASASLSDYTKVTSFSAETILYEVEKEEDPDTTDFIYTQKAYYYVFGADGSVTRYKYYLDDADNIVGKSSNSVVFKFENGKLYKHADEADGGDYVGTLYKKGGAYYLIGEDEAWKRTSGSGLFATFGETYEETYTDTDNGTTYYAYKDVETISLTFCSDGTLYGSEDGETYKDNTLAESYAVGITGTFTNSSGILTVEANALISEVYNGTVYSAAESLGMGKILYDGSALYGYEPLSVKTALPQ